MEKWSEFLVRDSVSSNLASNLLDAVGPELTESDRQALATSVTCKDDLKALNRIAKRVANSIPAEMLDELNEELAEIKEDFAFAKSKRGKTVLQINEWAQGFYKQWRADSRFIDLYIGTHGPSGQIMLTGTAQSAGDLEDAIAFVVAQSPPRKLVVDAKVNTDKP